ncbi:uncharacterized protein LOC110036604 [Phalaenopsis equestris]|uniref:uncharacterized protein LOC110036604 n=1 Tax=Phalaenopsis equestris TaxID=78828 RepID=UPI0009E24D66|nr:uncharacterized protein LOC110036604 [Phalaenopsis equestris]
MATPIDVNSDAQWTRATYAGVVGRAYDLLQNPEKLIFPQEFHDNAVGKNNCPYIHPLGFKDGETAVYFSNQDLLTLKDEVKFTLIGKFQFWHPKIELVRKFFESLNFIGAWRIRLLDWIHLLIQLSVEEDYARIFAKQSLVTAEVTMKIQKWTSDFDPSKEPPVVPIWYKLPDLPLPFFKFIALFNIGRALGTPLKVDTPTFNKARLAIARIQVERDVTLPEVKRIWIGSENEGFWKETLAEQKPYYCQHCKMFGHILDRCYRLHPPSRKTSNAQAKETHVDSEQVTRTANAEVPTREGACLKNCH